MSGFSKVQESFNTRSVLGIFSEMNVNDVITQHVKGNPTMMSQCKHTNLVFPRSFDLG